MAISEELAKAIENYIKRNASDSEKKTIDSWHHSFDDTNLTIDSDEMDREAKIDNAIRARLAKTTGVEDITEKPAKTLRVSPIFRLAAAAAVAFIAIALSLWAMDNYSKKASFTNIKPGKNVAVLTLASGRKIILSGPGRGQLASESGVSITKTRDGQLVYTVAPGESNAGKSLETRSREMSSVNSIETPNGGKYQVNLPDGTRVWLNSASSLRYPIRFKDNERRVELNGEAYFEVAHNKKAPFRVFTDKQTVEVLGTHFNINSYADETAVKTTLLEGSVKISELHSKTSKILVPGQQAVLQAGALSVLRADLAVEMAWKNGEFVFTNHDFRTEMRQVARWYNVEIEVDDSVPAEIDLSGFISREKSISAVIKVIELAGGVHFTMQGRKILVSR